MNPYQPHHHKAHWPAIVFGVLAIGAMALILAFGAEDTNKSSLAPADPDAAESPSSDAGLPWRKPP